MSDKQEYQIMVTVSDIKIIIDKSVNQNVGESKSFDVDPSIIGILSKKVQDFEKLNQNFKIVKKNSVYYPNPTKKTTPFLKVDGYCSLCPKGSQRTHYYFSTVERFDETKDYVIFRALRKGEHIHEQQENKPQQFRGEKQVQLHQKINDEFHGSLQKIGDDDNDETEQQNMDNMSKINLHKSFLENMKLKDSTRKNGKDFADKQKKETIKAKSPFNQVFIEIKNKVKKDPRLTNSSKELNVLYSPLFLEFLLEKYMPYCFIWTSFSMNNLSFSRMTNGRIEKYNLFAKRNVPKKIRPHRYLNSVSQTIKGHCIDFMSKIKQKSKTTRCIKTPYTKNNSVIEMDDSDYVDQNNAVESWNKPSTSGLKKEQVGFQAETDFV
ncbi:unnamed protein product [Brachionus calyciflorus]|uniref:Uncharacterized protein n=1 Tax=Brachionus calyciflorus TaxID=104777 RepID=A0A814PIW9_9BILA|nr:unnamed protein product [Brachionus calyciflorus]